MDNNNWRPIQGADLVAMDSVDWRTQLQPDSRQRIVNKIMDTLKKHLPYSGPEGIHELKKIAERFEEKIYTAATSQSDYLRKISLKMLTMETKSQNTMPNQVNNSNRQPGQGIGTLGMQPQVHNQAQSLGMPLPPNQTQTRQQILPQNIPNPVGVQSSSSLSSGMPQTSSLTQNTMPNVVGQNPSMQGVQANSQNSVGNPMGQQGVPNMYANSQRQQMPGRQQIVNQQQQQQPQNNQQQYLYQQQLQQQLMKPKFQNPSMIQSHMQQQQQQQNLLQPNQLQPSQQQSAIQTSAPMQQQQPSMMQSSHSAQNQVSSVQQQPKPMLQQQHPQAVHRQQQQQQQQQPQQMPQQQLIGQQANSASMQQSHLIGQQNNVGDMQQQQQPQRMFGQQNNLSNIQQQQLMAQQENLSILHQQQLGPQSNVNTLQQQQMIGSQGGNSNMQTNQHSVHMLQQQSKPQLPQQQQQQQQQQSQPQQQQIQQQPNMPQRLQQSGQPTGPMLQSQNVMDQQKQMYQTQRAHPDTSSTQTGLANGGDWQEEIYQKIKQMKDQYLPELSEMYQKIVTKLHQHDSIPHPPKSDQFEKLKLIRSMLERVITFLQITKAGIQHGYKEKLAQYEKQIISFINTNRPRKSGPQMQQSHMHPMQQPQSQMNQLQQSHDSQMNPQMQSMPAMQQNNNIATLQQNPMMDSGQGNSMNSMQQHVPEGSLQQQQKIPVNVPPHQQQTNVMQPNMSSPDMIRHPIIKQEQQQQQQILQNQQQYKQQFQHRQMQQQILQKQQLLQQQHQQAKQNQIQQLQQINDVNEMKTRQSLSVKPSVLQQQQQQRSGYSINQPMKSGSPFSMSSSQLLQTSSPQLLQHSSPQVNQQSMLQVDQHSMAPSPMPGDSEKPVLGVSSLSNVGGQQQMSSGAVAPAQSLAIGTPGISASPLLAEFSGPDGTHGNALAAVSGKSSVTELPLERLMKAVKSMSSKALSTAVSDIGSVVSMMDRIAGSAPGNGSRAAVGEDLVAMTKCRLQGRNFLTQENGSTNGATKKMKRYTSAVPLNVVSSASRVNDSFKQTESAELGSTATSSFKRTKLQANLALWEEIKEINQCLIDTVVDISDEETDLGSAAAIVEGTIVKCSFTAMALSPNLKSQYASARMSPIQPLRLLVPTNYPNCSPVLLDKIPVDFSKEYEDLSVKAKSRFSISLRSLSQPMSLAAIARIWDVCARTVISEHAQISGGGSFSSKYGTWENCLSAA